MAALTLLVAGCNKAAQPEAEAPAAPLTSLTMSAEQQAEIRTLIRDTLVNDPQVLSDAIEALQQHRVDEAFTKMATDERAFSLGPRNAPITIVEFFDYQCTFCHRAMNWVFATQNARNDVRVVFMEMPSLGPQSLEAARAAAASIPQGRYIAFHRNLMTHQGELNSAAIDAIAQRSGVDVARMRRDMGNPAITTLIEDTHGMASAVGGEGTPLFMINGRMVSGYNEEALTAALAAATAEVRANRDRT